MTTVNINATLDAVFELCPSEKFDRLIGGRCPNNRIRSTICHPHEALTLLQRQFQDQDLVAAGVAKPNAFDELQIVPELCHAGGVIIALRKNPAEPPFDLLTARGSLVGGRHPVLSALDDGRRKSMVEETGMMLAAHRIDSVAVLDLINLPATYGFGLSRMSVSDCREVDTLFGEGLPRFSVSVPEQEQGAVDAIDAEEDSYWEPPGPNESLAFQPMLVFLDRLGQRPGDEPSRWLQNTALWFAKVRRHAGLPFSGVWVWHPDDEFWERLKFAFKMRESAHIREVVLQSMTSLVGIEAFVESVGDQCDEAPGYLAARRTLIGQLTVREIELPAQSGQLSDSLAQYDSAVCRELAEPLITWASQNFNPVIRAAGAQLAEVVTLLHRITPRLHALQTHRLAESIGGSSASLQSELFDEYMRLLDKFGRLNGEIANWMKP